MTYQTENTPFNQAMELLIQNGFNDIAEPIGILMNVAMKIERAQFLKASPYERTDQRQGYANGFKEKTVHSRVGSIQLDIPQTRKPAFYPTSLERGLRSERALKLALADMYVQGVSTRKVAKITETLCGFEVSSRSMSENAFGPNSSLFAKFYPRNINYMPAVKFSKCLDLSPKAYSRTSS